MKTNTILDQVEDAIQTIEKHNVKCNYQKLDEILPIVLTILKCKATDMEAKVFKHKYYVPSWIKSFLVSLDNDDEPLDDIDYAIFASQAESLSLDDFKYAGDALLDYQAIDLTSQEAVEMVSSIKKYFKLA